MSKLRARGEKKDPQTLDLLAELRGHQQTLGQLAALLGHLSTLPHFPELNPLELAVEMNRIVPLDEAARLRGTSQDTVKRNDADKIIKLSPRREGMRVKHALML